MADTIKKILDEEGLKTFWELNKTYINDYVNSKLFVGTMAEYAVAESSGKINVGALVILTDASGSLPPTSGGTSAKLGTAVLGKMILGQA